MFEALDHPQGADDLGPEIFLVSAPKKQEERFSRKEFFQARDPLVPEQYVKNRLKRKSLK
jgi:hypothetical protein